MFVISIASFLMAIILAKSLIESERTGIAHYSKDPQLPDKEIVTRAQAPAKFHQAITFIAFETLLCGSVGAASFWFYRRLSK